MRGYAWYKGNFVSSLHKAAILSTTYDKQSFFNIFYLFIFSSLELLFIDI